MSAKFKRQPLLVTRASARRAALCAIVDSVSLRLQAQHAPDPSTLYVGLRGLAGERWTVLVQVGGGFLNTRTMRVIEHLGPRVN